MQQRNLIPPKNDSDFEEIAYKMYQTNNNRLYVVSDEIKKIITYLSSKESKLRDNDALQKMIEQCYALCNYWKETGDGAVELFEHRLMSGYVSISNRIDIYSLNLSGSNLRKMDFQGAYLRGAK